MEAQSKNISLKATLIAIGIGIWVIVLQNAGVIPTSQRVQVVNTVDVDGSVSVHGTVDVDDIKSTVNISGSVDADITRINGHGNFYDHGGDGVYDRIAVYTGY